MIDPQQRMIDKQAEIITSLREQIESQAKRLDSAQHYIDTSMRAAEFYKILEKSIGSNESLRAAWDDFIMVLRLVHPDLNNEFKNVNLARGFNV